LINLALFNAEHQTYRATTMFSFSLSISKLIKPLFLFVVFAVFEIVIIIGFTSYYSREKQNYTAELTERLETVVNAVVNIYALVSQTIFEEVVNKQDIIDLFKYAHTANIEEQAIIRKKMYEKLKATYERLEQKNLRQLHFHLPDNTSFLRMHKPEQFGDNLSSVRYSVKMVNELKKPIQGFEEGRIFNGFRYVFPVFDDTTHIGSVEASIAFDGIHKEISKLYPLEYQMILKKDVVFGTVFSKEQGNYEQCLISNEYMCESEKLRKLYDRPFSRTTMKEIDNFLKNKLNEKLNQNKAFVSPIRLNGINYVLTFHPIKSLRGEVVSYIIGYHENNHFVELDHDLYVKLVIFSLLNMLSFLFLYGIQRHNKLIEGKNQRLIKLDQEKNEFLGVVIHDLKNPLSGIQTFSEEIKTNYDQLSREEVVEFSDLIHDSSKRMFVLISNLLDINAIESGKFTLQFEQLELLSMIKNILHIYQSSANAKQVIMQLNSSSDSYPIYADKNAVVQILDNLISNAVKYSPWEKTVLINIEEKQNFICCSVKNEGAGFTEKDLQKLFQKFSKLSTQPTNGEHSTGLGLFIVKKLAESIHADIWCESEQGKGVIFTVSFPQHPQN
jgi:signal transduction histidine kinase